MTLRRRFWEVFSKGTHRGKLHYSAPFFSHPIGWHRVIFIEGAKPSPDCKMRKLLTVDNLFLLLRHFGLIPEFNEDSYPVFPPKMMLVYARAQHSIGKISPSKSFSLVRILYKVSIERSEKREKRKLTVVSWLSMHPRNFGSDKIVPRYVRPPLHIIMLVKFCISRMLHVLAVNCMATQT